MKQPYIRRIYDFLTSCALQQRYTYYREVAQNVGLDLGQDKDYDLLTGSFSGINKALKARGFPMLTAIVSDEKAFLRNQPYPSSGFFMCARDELHYIIDDGVQFYREQLRMIFAVQQWP